MMETRPTRRFTLLDALVLLAATAAALGLARRFFDVPPETGVLFEPYPGGGVKREPPGGWGPRALLRYGPHFLALLTPAAAAFSAALLALRSRRPRPSRRAIGRQPGFAACLAGTLAVGLALVPALVRLVRGRLAGEIAGPRLAEAVTFHFEDAIMETTPGYAAFGVAAAWTLLAIGRAWRAEPTWIDRAGRAVGVLWIVLGLVAWWRPIHEELLGPRLPAVWNTF